MPGSAHVCMIQCASVSRVIFGKCVYLNFCALQHLFRYWNQFRRLSQVGVNVILPNETEANKTQTVSEYQNSSIRLENDQYCAKLPWKDNHPPLPTNQSIARGRTRSTVRRLSKEPPMLAAYNKIIQEQLQRGFIEKVADPQSTTGRVHYIPHHNNATSYCVRLQL